MSSDLPKPADPESPDRADTVDERAVNPLDQTLVSYLDGELTDAETETVELRLASDAGLRSRLHALQATWDMLDELPAVEPERAFLESTIELVITSAQRKKMRWHRWPLRIAAALLAFGLSTGIALQVVRSIQFAPYRELVDNLDFYQNSRMLGDIDVPFLEELVARDVFEQGSEPELYDGQVVSSSERFDQLSDSEKSVLKGRMEGFLKKTDDRQRELKDLHGQIQNHPDHVELIVALQAFEEWIEGVKPEERPKFRSGEAEQRVDEIQQYNWNMAKESFGIAGPTQLPDHDVREFLRWVEGFTRSKNDVIITRLEQIRDGNRTQPGRSGRSDSWRYAFLMLAYVNEEAAIELIEPADIQELSRRLSPKGVEILENQSEGQNQKKLVLRWMGAAIMSLRSREMTHAELADHYNNNMDAEERRQVDRLLPSKRKRAIQFDRSRQFGGRGMRDGRRGDPSRPDKKPRNDGR